jgi:hypothetical protein
MFQNNEDIRMKLIKIFNSTIQIVTDNINKKKLG